MTDEGRMGEYTEKELTAVIGKGKGMMPAFAAVLSAKDLEAVAAYVHSLSHVDKTGD